MVAFTALAFAASLAGFAAADLTVTKPTSSIWWVAGHDNELSWSCQDSTHDTFTIFVANDDINVLTSPIAIKSIQNNFDCSLLVRQTMLNQGPGNGYRVLLTNTLNSSDVYARSEPFEIRPTTANYPPTTTAASPGGSATGTGTGANANNTAGASGQNNSNDATSLKNVGFGLVAAAAAGVAYLL